MSVVLVVDDSCIIRSAISSFLHLQWPDLQVLEAFNGEEGLALAQQRKPDLILLDAEMPVMNGYQMAQALRQAPDTKTIPLIAISASSQNNPIVARLLALCNAYLPKPFAVDELIQVVQRLCVSV